MKKNLIWGLVALVIIVGVGYWYSTNEGNSVNTEATQETVKVGAILPLTGPGAVFADYIKKGLELRLEEINKSDKKIALIYEDSQNKPAVGITALKKLQNIDNVNIMIPALSSVCKALTSFSGEESSLQLGTAVAFPNYTDGNPYVFRFYPTAENVSGVMAKYFIDSIKYNSVGVIYINDEFGKACLNSFKNSIEGKKNLVYSESYEISQKDFKQTIEKLNSSSANAVYIAGYGPAYTSFIKQLRELQKRDYIIMGDMTLGLPTTFKQLGSLMNGVYYVDGEMSTEFINKYENKYGDKPSTYAGYAYDLLGILEKSISTVKTNDIQKIAAQLSKTQGYKGCMGNDIGIDSYRELEQKFLVHKVIDERIVVIK